MPKLTGSTITLSGGSSYLLREGGTATIRVVSGACSPWNRDEVAKTRLTVWSASGNAFVSEGGESIVRVTQNVPAAANGPFQSGSELRTVVVYDSQPASDSYWQWDVPIAGRDGCYGDEHYAQSDEALAALRKALAGDSVFAPVVLTVYTAHGSVTVENINESSNRFADGTLTSEAQDGSSKCPILGSSTRATRS